MSLTVVKGNGLGKSPLFRQFLNTRVVPWNSLMAPSNLWLKDLNMKRDWERWHMTTHFFSEGLGGRTGAGIFQKGEICALITHTCYFIPPTVFLAADIAFALKMCCFPYGRGGKNESVSLLSS